MTRDEEMGAIAEFLSKRKARKLPPRKAAADHKRRKSTKPREIKGGRAWLRANDPDYRKTMKKAKRARTAAKRQARDNPQLADEFRKVMFNRI